jgi:hypothetical protein
MHFTYWPTSSKWPAVNRTPRLSYFLSSELQWGGSRISRAQVIQRCPTRWYSEAPRSNSRLNELLLGTVVKQEKCIAVLPNGLFRNSEKLSWNGQGANPSGHLALSPRVWAWLVSAATRGRSASHDFGFEYSRK